MGCGLLGMGYGVWGVGCGVWGVGISKIETDCPKQFIANGIFRTYLNAVLYKTVDTAIYCVSMKIKSS